MSKKISYKDAGVDVKEGARAVELMKDAVKSTYREGVLGGIGSFGGMFRLGEFKKPCLISGTDGVGTKLKIAFAMDKHDTVGIDLVAMSVNDILCQGAEPLFFLDYVATGKVSAEKIANIVSGVADGCRQGKMALLGGETAEMSGFYADGEYDLAGFAVGVAEEDQLIDGSATKKGDLLIGLPSSGVHSNGYSLVRRLFKESEFGDIHKELGCTLGEALLRPTRIYVDAMWPLLFGKKGEPARHGESAPSARSAVRGIVHMTGGGFYENIPRAIPAGMGALINKGSWDIPPIFKLIQSRGVEEDEMYRTFNMGIGLLLIVDAARAKEVEALLSENGEKYFEIGRVESLEELKASGLLPEERVLLR